MYDNNYSKFEISSSRKKYPLNSLKEICSNNDLSNQYINNRFINRSILKQFEDNNLYSISDYSIICVDIYNEDYNAGILDNVYYMDIRLIEYALVSLVGMDGLIIEYSNDCIIVITSIVVDTEMLELKKNILSKIKDMSITYKVVLNDVTNQDASSFSKKYTELKEQRYTDLHKKLTLLARINKFKQELNYLIKFYYNTCFNEEIMTISQYLDKLIVEYYN